MRRASQEPMEQISLWLGAMLGIGFLFGMWVVLFRRDPAPLERARAVYGHAYDEILPTRKLGGNRRQPVERPEPDEPEEEDLDMPTPQEQEEELLERAGWAVENEEQLQAQSEVTASEGIEVSDVSEDEVDDFAERLAREGAKTGDVQISLIWNNYNDLDLHVVCPSGERIFFDNRNSKCSGELDVDMNVKPTSRKPVENVYWPENMAPRGTYRVYVHHYAKHSRGLRSNKDPTTFRVLVNMEGTKKEFKGDISNGEPLRLISEFTLEQRDDIPPPPPSEESEPFADIEELLEDIEQDETENLDGDIGAEYADEQLSEHLEERSAWAEEQEEEFQALMQSATDEGVESGEVTRRVESKHSKRLKREGAESSDVQISLIWNNYNDLDLHVVAPSGERLFYHNRESECGGRLDIDMNLQPTSRKPVENVYWPLGEAPRGAYKVYLHHHQLHRRGLRRTKDPTEFSVLVNAEGEKREHKGRITIDDPLKLIAEFTLEDAEDLLDDIEESVDPLSEEELAEQLEERSRWASENEEHIQAQTEVSAEEVIEGTELDEETADEFTKRMEREGAKSGGVQISLIWNNYNDLDLHVVAPSGERIFFDNRNSKCGGELDVDMNVKPTSRKPIENVYWPDEQTPRGTYKVYVHHYAVHRKGLRSNKDPTAFSVLVNAEGEKKEFKGEISNGEPLRLISEFTLP